MNFFSAHDVILEYSKKIGLPYKLEHNKFSLMASFWYLKNKSLIVDFD